MKGVSGKTVELARIHRYEPIKWVKKEKFAARSGVYCLQGDVKTAS
jgi:hypothetical protein